MTTFYFVRHGEPDYDSVREWKQIPFGKDFAGLTEAGVMQIRETAMLLKRCNPQIIISSPFTRTMQGAGIIAGECNIPILVEKDLHEWSSDRTHTIGREDDLLQLCKDFDLCNGIYPQGIEKQWESRQSVRERVLKVLGKYLEYEVVIVSGHAIMMQAVTGEQKAFQYGEIVKRTWEELQSTQE